MEILLMLAGVIIITIFGLYKILKELKAGDIYTLYLIVKDQEDYVEGYLRNVVKRIKREGIPGRLVVLVGSSRDQTGEIVQRLSRKLSFIVREIK